MKTTVQLLQPTEERDKWLMLFHHLGVEGTHLNGEAQLLAMCRQQRGGLLVAASGLLKACAVTTQQVLADWTTAGGGVILTGVAAGDTKFPFACEEFTELSDPLTINGLLLRYLPDYSRHQPRLEISLPGLCLVNDNYHFCEIHSLGPGGAFIKTGVKPPQKDSLVRVHVPLIGMRKEMELQGRVVRQVLPHETNNYMQGFGVSFQEVAAELLTDLHLYVRNVVCDQESLQPFNAACSPALTRLPVAATATERQKRLVFSW